MSDSYLEQLKESADWAGTYLSGVSGTTEEDKTEMASAREWESSGMDDETLLEKFREWIYDTRESGALRVCIPLPAAEQIFSHFEAWERRPLAEATLASGPQHVDGDRASKLVQASKNLLEACYRADSIEELSGEIDGSLLDALGSVLRAMAEDEAYAVDSAPPSPAPSGLPQNESALTSGDGSESAGLRAIIPEAIWKQYDDSVDKAHSVGAFKELKRMQAKIGALFIDAALAPAGKRYT